MPTPAQSRGTASRRNYPVVIIGGIDKCANANLAQIIDALYPLGPGFGARQGRQKQRRQDRDDRDDHQQLD